MSAPTTDDSAAGATDQGADVVGTRAEYFDDGENVAVRRDSRMRRTRPGAWLAATYAILVGAFLWPVPVRPSSTIYGYGGDGFGVIWELGRRSSATPLFWRSTFEDNLSYPVGYQQSNLTRITSVVPDLIALPLSRFVGAVATYNFLVALGLFLTAMAAAWLVSYATGSRSVGFWGGLAFALFPFIQLAATSWPSFTHMYWLPLVVLGAFHYADGASFRRLLLLPALVVGATLTNPYIGFFALVVLIASGVIWVPVAVRQLRLAPRSTRRLVLWIAAAMSLGVLLAVGVLVVALRGSVERELSDLDVYGLRLAELVRPTVVNRFSSELIEPTSSAGYHGSNTTEIAQYVGWSTIVLAVVGFGAPRSRLRESRQWLLSLTGMGLGLVFAMSHAMFFGLVPAPGRVLHEFAPFFRVYSRFGVVVYLFLLVAAGHGVLALVRGRDQVWRLAIVGVLCAVTFVELWAPLPGRSTAIERPEFTRSVSDESDPVVAMYPIVRSDDGYFYNQLLWALYLPEGTQLVNGGPTDADGEGLRDQIRSLNTDATWADLDDLLVDYVVVDKRAYRDRYGFDADLSGRNVIFDDERFAVIELPGNGADLVGWTSGDQLPAEVRASGPSWRWLGSDAELHVRAQTDACVRVSAAVAAPDGDTGLVLRSDVEGGPAYPAEPDDGRLSVFVPVGAGTTVLELVPDRELSQLSESDVRLGTLYMSDVAITVVPDERCS